MKTPGLFGVRKLASASLSVMQKARRLFGVRWLDTAFLAVWHTAGP
jgi:hypothetical protein